MRTVVCSLALFALVPYAHAQSVSSRADAATGFATSVLVIGDDILVGRNGGGAALPIYPQAGGVHVYARNADREWREVGAIVPSGGMVGNEFGAAMDARGDWLLVGAPGEDSASGAAYLFERTPRGWMERARLAPGGAAQRAGSAVVLGDTLVALGAPSTTGPGAVYVYMRDADGSWTMRERLTAGSDSGDVDQFGTTLAWWEHRLYVGAPRADARRGAVYAFRAGEGGWIAQPPLRFDDGAAGDRLGTSLVGIGDVLVVGAPGYNGGRGTAVVAALFPDGTGWRELLRITAPDTAMTGFGATVTAHGTGDPQAWISASGSRAVPGVIYVIRDDGADSAIISQIIAPRSFSPIEGFGSAMAVSRDVAVVAAGAADLRTGAAAVFQRDADGVWDEVTTLHDPTRGSFARMTGDTVPCVDGAVGTFRCSEIDLVAFLPLAEVGAGSGSIANDIWGWTDEATGREFVLLALSNGTSFVEITNPTRPVHLGTLPLTAGATENLWRDVKTYGNHAYIVADGAGEHGVQVFDLTQLRNVRHPPVTFTETARYTGVHSAHNIAINRETGFAYVVGSSGGGETCGGALHMLDLRDPANPTFAGCHADPGTGFRRTGYTHDTQCVMYRGPDASYRDREICFNSSETALGIADVTDKANPRAIAHAAYPGVSYAHQGWLTDDHRFFFMGDEGDETSGQVERTRTLVWDVSDLDDPVLLTEYFATTRAIDHNQYIRGRYVYQSNLMSGLRILDIADPAHPVEVGFFDTVPSDDDVTAFGGSWSNYPFFASGVVAVSSWNEGLFLLQRREPALVP